MDDVWYLKQIDWLHELEPDDWERLRSQATRHLYASGQTIFLPTPDARSVYLLEEGRVRIYRLSRTGDEVTFGYIAPGEVFGELAGFGEQERKSFALAQTECVAWKIPVALFREWVTTRPHMVLEVTRQMGERMRRVESRVEDLVFRNVRARLASVLLELAENFGAEMGEGHKIDLRLSQEDLANLIGASRQSVNVALARLREEELVSQDEGHLLVTDPARLRAIVDSGR
ncbi:MAG: Crp/Fnr family transcriptional regulator [Myxococcales bacterium]|nr:Crp/Fnr family transcriptional regulator [Myxococcales bacterium]